MTHELKTIPIYFKSIWDGRKRFEIRKYDRDFMVGDYVTLREYDSLTGNYSGREVFARISYLTTFEQKDGYVVFGFHELKRVEKK